MSGLKIELIKIIYEFVCNKFFLFTIELLIALSISVIIHCFSLILSLLWL
jgi:hypothetical protein